MISANIHRRHMTKGQIAMAVAIIYPEPETGGRGKKSSKMEEFRVGGSYLMRKRLADALYLFLGLSIVIVIGSAIAMIP